MQITSLSIKNFKSLYDISPANFGSINMVFGLNNSGKSNLLKFMYLLFKTGVTSTPIRVQDETGTIQERIERDESDFWDKEISNTNYLFYRNNYKKDIIFTVTMKVNAKNITHHKLLIKNGYFEDDTNDVNFFIKGKVKSTDGLTSLLTFDEININRKNIFEYKNNSQNFFNGSKDPELTDNIFEDIIRIFNNCVLLLDTDRYFVSENEESILDTLSSKNFKNWLFHLYLQNYDLFEDLLKSLSNFELVANGSQIIQNNFKNFPLSESDIGFTKFENELEVMLKNKVGGRYPLNSYGTGVQQILYILSKLFSAAGKIVLIEELELNLSPYYQLMILEHLNKLIENSSDDRMISQVFFTTHSKYFYKRTDLLDLYEVKIDKKGRSEISKATKTRTNGYFERNYY